MPDYSFERCDRHHEKLDFRFLPSEKPRPSNLDGEQRAGPGTLASASQAGGLR